MGTIVTKFDVANNSLNITTIISFPIKEADGSIFSDNNRKYAIIDAYASVIIASLERRMDACMDQLLKYRKNVIFNDGNSVVYKRNDGSLHSFNVPSYKSMQDAIQTLKEGGSIAFLDRCSWVDQSLKALLNDSECEKKDVKGFRFSDLVSVLCEAHAFRCA